MKTTYNTPTVTVNSSDTPTPYACNLPIVGLAVYVFGIFDVVLAINWGGFFNLITSSNAIDVTSA